MIFVNYHWRRLPNLSANKAGPVATVLSQVPRTCDIYDHQDSVRIDTSKPKINLQRLIPFVRNSITVSRSTNQH